MPLGPAAFAVVFGKGANGVMPTNPVATPTTVFVLVSMISTPLLLRSARYNFWVSGLNQLMSTLHRLFAEGILMRGVTNPLQGSGLGVVAGGGTCGTTRIPPLTTQLDVIRFPLTPKFASASASESARTFATPATSIADKINEDDPR